MRARLLPGVTVAVLALTPVAATAGQLPGAQTIRICAAAGPYWPTMTLALQGRWAWIACKEQSRVIRVDTTRRSPTRAVRLGSPVIAVASGFGSVWALGSSGTLYRLSPATAKVAARTDLGVRAAYNVWVGGGSVWVADDQGAQVVRLSPRTNRVVARIPVGDGPADMAFSEDTAWVINHRDRTLTSIALATNRSTPLAAVGGDAPERMVWAAGHLWVTGRGTDLLQVDPADGSVEQTIEIGASGIDVAADGDTLWIPTRSPTIDQSGFPTLDSLVRVSISSMAVSIAAHTVGRVDVHGLAARADALWLADNSAGILYRFAG